MKARELSFNVCISTPQVEDRKDNSCGQLIDMESEVSNKGLMI